MSGNRRPVWRQYAAISPKEYSLGDLVGGIAAKNYYTEIGYGDPIGVEAL